MPPKHGMPPKKRRYAANDKAVVLLSFLGWSDARILELLDGRTLKFEPFLDPDLWTRFGDGGNFCELAERQRRRDEEEMESLRESERGSALRLIGYIWKKMTKEETETELRGAIADDVWAQAESYGTKFSPESDASNDLLHDIEDTDRRHKEDRTILWVDLMGRWLCDADGVKTEHAGSWAAGDQPDDLKRLLAATVPDGWRVVGLKDSSDEVEALFQEIGILPKATRNAVPAGGGPRDLTDDEWDCVRTKAAAQLANFIPSGTADSLFDMGDNQNTDDAENPDH